MFGKKWKTFEVSLQTMHGQIEVLRSDIAQRTRDIEAIRSQIRVFEERLGNADARATQMTTEITNQLHELNSELEQLAQSADAASAQAVADLRSNQVRIASEQARYAITLRQDLAELAELLRRTRG
jgi:chromosome segregation ATPase